MPTHLTLEPARRRLGHPRVALVALWLAGCACGTAWYLNRAVENLQARTQSDFDRAYSTLVQRLDHNEALLDGLVALLRSSRDPEFRELRRYADETLRRYPHLYTIGYQPRVDHAQRDDFERRMSEQLGRAFLIRDYSIESDRTWRVAPARAFYYPATFMAPELPEAQDVIGYDGYGDPLFRAAIADAGRSDHAVATPPFDLVEGGRGYVLLRALDLETATGAPGRERPAAHVVSLLVRADRLLASLRLPANARLELRQRDAAGAAAASIGAVGRATDTAAAMWWTALPATHIRRAVPSAFQPFELDLQVPLAWSDIAWPGLALGLAAWSAVVLAGGLAARALLRARRAAALARSDLASAERRAESSRARSLDELGASIAHELNQPLAAVVGYSQTALRLLESSPTVQPALREALQGNVDQAMRAADLIQRLRSLVRRRPLRFEPVSMQDVLGRALRLEQPRLDEAGIAVVVRGPAVRVMLRGDALLLEQLFGNLLRNAVEALTARDATARHIAIQLEAQGGDCRVSVSDSGPGLKPEQRSRAFHPFRSTKAGGIGIGLVVCAAIAEAHGGTIAAEAASTEADGVGGARFVVTLPLAPARALPPP